MNRQQKLIEKLESIEQERLLSCWKTLNEGEKERLAQQVEEIDIPVFRLQQAELSASPSAADASFAPFIPAASFGNIQDVDSGRQLRAKGKGGCLVVAGGQGTRLRFEAPKGMYPISPVKMKSLFQLLAEKILAASRQAGHAIPLAIMTSPLNHDSTRQFFSEHRNFGLPEGQLSFFTQKTLPLLTPEGNLFLEEPGAIACGPDGNGGSLHRFYESGIWKKWWDAGVRHLHYALIDNPLCDPVDAELLGFHERTQAEVTVKCILREDPNEHVGVLVRKNGHLAVVEYMEIPDQERTALDPDGRLKHPCANISAFCFDMLFIERVAAQQLPLHKAYKAVKKETTPGNFLLSDQPCAWKFERFIFDVLPFAERVQGLLYERNVCYAPLKSLSGAGSPDSVRKALMARDRQILRTISGQGVGDKVLELAQDFYYPTQALLAKWKYQQIPQGSYIEASLD